MRMNLGSVPGSAAACGLPPGQYNAVVAIVTLLRRHGRAPSVRELAVEMGVRSPNGVVVHLDALERKGWLTRGRDGGHAKARSIRLTGLVLRYEFAESSQGRCLRALFEEVVKSEAV
jgi:SOS-response transcriptional repressor LexA